MEEFYVTFDMDKETLGRVQKAFVGENSQLIFTSGETSFSITDASGKKLAEGRQTKYFSGTDVIFKESVEQEEGSLDEHSRLTLREHTIGYMGVSSANIRSKNV